MIALQIAATIQDGQSLGVALDAQDSLAALIEREAVGVPDLAAVGRIATATFVIADDIAANEVVLEEVSE